MRWIYLCIAAAAAYQAHFREIARDNRPRGMAKRFMVDIDGTICTLTASEYDRCKPFYNRIAALNRLYDQGVEVHYWTARGANSGHNWDELTKQQLQEWGVKYTTLNMDKPHYDVWIDDKSVPIDTLASDAGNDAVDECILNGFDGCEGLGYT